MNVLLSTTILGEPVGQGRPRAVRMGAFVRVHNAPKSAQWQAIAAAQMAEEWGGKPPIDEPVRLVAEVICRRPASVPKRYGRGRQWCTRKPDLDNVIKSLLDAIVQAGCLRDDASVVQVRAAQYIAADGETPCVSAYLQRADPCDVIPWPEKTKRTA